MPTLDNPRSLHNDNDNDNDEDEDNDDDDDHVDNDNGKQASFNEGVKRRTIDVHPNLERDTASPVPQHKRSEDELLFLPNPTPPFSNSVPSTVGARELWQECEAAIQTTYQWGSQALMLLDESERRWSGFPLLTQWPQLGGEDGRLANTREALNRVAFFDAIVRSVRR